MNYEYPELPEAGLIEADKLVDKFKKELMKVASDTIGDLYGGIMPHIESDSWSNFRTQLMTELRGYSKNTMFSSYELKDIRQGILKEHREELISDLNQDLLDEIESLKKQIEYINQYR